MSLELNERAIGRIVQLIKDCEIKSRLIRKGWPFKQESDGIISIDSLLQERVFSFNITICFLRPPSLGIFDETFTRRKNKELPDDNLMVHLCQDVRDIMKVVNELSTAPAIISQLDSKICELQEKVAQKELVQSWK